MQNYEVFYINPLENNISKCKPLNIEFSSKEDMNENIFTKEDIEEGVQLIINSLISAAKICFNKELTEDIGELLFNIMVEDYYTKKIKHTPLSLKQSLESQNDENLTIIIDVLSKLFL